MYIRTPRASAWVEANVPDMDRPANPSSTRHVQVRFAVRPLNTPAGSCRAVKMVSTQNGGSDEQRFYVLFESRYTRSPAPRWVPVQQVLGEDELAAWLRDGFRT
jgi:hypothetical protein